MGSKALHHEPKIVEGRAGQPVAAAVCVSLSWTRNDCFSGVITFLSSRASQPIAHSKNGVFPFTSFFNWLRNKSPLVLSASQIWPATVPISSCTHSSFCDTVKNKGGAGPLAAPVISSKTDYCLSYTAVLLVFIPFASVPCIVTVRVFPSADRTMRPLSMILPPFFTVTASVWSSILL